MKNNIISIKKARVNNLKNISLDIPRDKFVVITGLSGSGKSSLAFDTIYAEGQRRYVESLSAYARQFLGIMEKPAVEQISGLSPAIAIDQKNISKNPRSTVGTVTEIYDYLRLLYARVGQPHCPHCGQPAIKQKKSEIVQKIKKLPPHTKIILLAPLIKNKKGNQQHLLMETKRAGFSRLRLNQKIYSLDTAINLNISCKKPQNIEIVIDQFTINQKLNTEQLSDSLDRALEMGNGSVTVNLPDQKRDVVYSQFFACPRCGTSLPELHPRNFSFNSPHGACSQCSGLGTKLEVDPDLIIPNKKLTLAQGAIKPWSSSVAGQQNYYLNILEALAEHYNFSLHTTVQDLPLKIIKILLTGPKNGVVDLSDNDTPLKFAGITKELEKRYQETDSDYIRGEIEHYMRVKKCPACQGKRLSPTALAVTVAGKTIDTVTAMTITTAIVFFKNLSQNKTLSDRERKIIESIQQEVSNRLSFLKNVGLEYLTLDRGAHTLAGGEAQRIRLATQIGSGLIDIIYVLDEPTIGLHQRDIDNFIKTLRNLRNLGNSVIVVEHDKNTMLAADHIIDIGPGAGKYGGEVVFSGSPAQLKTQVKSLTGQYLAGRKKIAVPRQYRSSQSKAIKIIGAKEFNLKNIDVTIPLGKLVSVTGVSGSGKSTLIDNILGRALARQFHGTKALPGKHQKITGLEYLNKVVRIDQSPIGRTPRSNPATYTGIFTYIRNIFTTTTEAKIRGYQAGRFSFNVKGGRCENCQGDGLVKIAMHFLPNVYVKCEECQGKRYNKATLDIHYQGKDITEILALTVNEAMSFFHRVVPIKQKLKILNEVGLGYVQLGQPATTLSGGEAQRIKLATELSRRATGKTLYILDEPTTGLHFDDIKKLLNVLNKLVDAGNTVLVIEHNLDVIKCADWVIDLGPEGGDHGGELVAQGTPREITKIKKSHTGQYLKKHLAE